MKKVRLGVIGAGTVGSGVIEALMKNNSLIKERSGVEVEIRAVCDKDAPLLEKIRLPEDTLKTSDFEDILKNPEIDIVAELIGGIEPALTIIKGALSEGKHVVTANKALLSEHWKEVLDSAQEKGLFLKFEASVGGAIPVIRTLRESFVGNDISAVYGILNGTANFILSMMVEDNASFEDALREAQKRGIAESDPTLDVSGADSAHKLAILAMLCFGREVFASDVYTEGISEIEIRDISNAARWGYGIKLLGIAKMSPKGLQLRVHPTLIKKEHLLSGVKGADNAIYIEGDLIGESLLFGKGAGKYPTASSVVGDIVEIAGWISSGNRDAADLPSIRYVTKPPCIERMEDMELGFYLRFSVIDKPGVLAGISGVLSANNISIANVAQEERNEGETVPVIIVTHKAREGDMRKAIAEIDPMDYVTSGTVAIRIEDR